MPRNTLPIRAAFSVRTAFAVLSVLTAQSLFCVFDTTMAHAQWSVVATFDTTVRVVYVLAPPNSRNWMTGTNSGKVYASTDSGASWKLNTTMFRGPVTNFTFRSKQEGWCSVADTLSKIPALHTTDGGGNWQALNQRGMGGSIVFNPVKNLLFLPMLDTTGLLSTDYGTTWSRSLPEHLSAINFEADGLHGLATGYKDTCYVTSNGGTTWLPTNIRVQGWESFVSPKAYVVMNRLDSVLYRSTNRGITWDSVFTLPDSGVGTVRGNLSLLSAQTAVGTFLLSEDSGATWSDMCGPTTAVVESRPYVDVRELWVPDAYNNIDHNGRSVVNFISIDCQEGLLLPLSIYRACDTTINVLRIRNNACDPLHIISARLTSGTNMRIDPTEFPTLVGASLGSGAIGLGVFHITAWSDVPGFFVDSLILRMRSGTKIVDTAFRLELTVGDYLPPRLADLTVQFASPCVQIDTAILITNYSCVPAVLTDSWIDKTTDIQIADPNPLVIPPHSSRYLRLKYYVVRPSVSFGVLHIHSVMGESIADTTVDLRFTTTGFVRPMVSVSATTLDFGTVGVCNSRTKQIVFKNTICDTLLITGIDFTAGAFQQAPLSFPIRLSPNDSVTANYTFTPVNSVPVSITLFVHLKVSNRLKDTLLTLSGKGTQGTLSTISSDTLDLGTIDLCAAEAASRSVEIFNASCDSLLIDYIENTSSEFSTSVFGGSKVIALSDSAKIIAAFVGTSAGNYSTTIRITLLAANGTRQTHEITLIAKAVKTTPKLSLPLVSIETSIPGCSSRDTAVSISAAGGCGTIDVLEITYSGDPEISIIKPALPMTLSDTELLQIPIHASAVQSGDLTGRIKVTTSAGDTTIALLFHAVGGAKHFELLTSALILSAAVCESDSGVVRLVNDGCGALEISSVKLSNATDFMLDPALVFPVRIEAGSEYRASIYYVGSTSATSILRIISNDAALTKDVQITGTRGGSVPTAGITVSFEPMAALNPGDVVRALFRFDNDLPSTVGLESVEMTLRSNEDLLEPKSLTGYGGWSGTLSRVSAGEYNIRWLHSGAITKDELMGQIEFKAYLTANAATEVSISAPKFNDGSQQFFDCKLQPLANTFNAIASIATFCSDSLIQNYLRREKRVLSALKVTVNPLENGMLRFGYLLRENRSLRIELIDMLGRTQVSREVSRSSGMNSESLSIGKVPLGSYILRIVGEDIRESRRVVVE